MGGGCGGGLSAPLSQEPDKYVMRVESSTLARKAEKCVRKENTHKTGWECWENLDGQIKGITYRYI